MANNVLHVDIPIIKELLLNVFNSSEYSELERMGGLTNHSYKVTLMNGDDYVVRIPGEGTAAMINRNHEKCSTELACKIGIDAPLLYFGADGAKVTKYIYGAKTMSIQTMRNAENLKQAAKILHKLHSCAEDTGVPFEIFDMVSTYEQIIQNYGVPFYDDYDAIKAQIMTIKQRVDAQSEISKVPCHNDVLCENWVLDGYGKMFLIDWEYAGMNDGMWDLADLSIEAALSYEQDEYLLTSYFERVPTAAEKERFQANKLYLDLLWSLWGKTRVPFAGEEMELYALERYLRLKQKLLCT